jgi:hypothetical protein
MAVRLWTALLPLAAVFTLHGLQCAVGDHTAGSPGAGGEQHAAVAALTLPAAAAGHAPAPGSVMAAAAAGHAPAPGSVMAAAPAHDAPKRTPHSTGQLWTVCLAVLAAGLAALLALILPRLVQLARSGLPRALADARRALMPLRPPDLSELCLLRI